MLHLSILFFCIISSFQALECFLSCGDFDNCDQPRCGGICEGSEEFSRLTFTTEECNTDEDRCIFREFLFLDSKSNSTKSMHIPGGCLLNYERSLDNVGNYLFEEGVRLVGCQGSLCNEPPVPSCGLTQLLGCLLDVDNLFQILSGSSQLRGGSANDRRGFCLNSELLEEFDEESPCFGITGPNILPSPSTCTSLAEIDDIPTLTCQECGASPDCDTNQTINFPDNEDNRTFSPTKLPTNSPSFPPSSSPTTNPPITSSFLAQLLSKEVLYALGVLAGLCICGTTVIIVVILFFSRTRKKSISEEDDETEFVILNHQVTLIDENSPEIYLTQPQPQMAPIVDNRMIDSVMVQQDLKRDGTESLGTMGTMEIAQVLEELDI